MSYQPPPAYPMQPPPKKKSPLLLIFGILGISLLLCCGGFSAWALATADDRATNDGGTATVDPTSSPSPAKPKRETDGADKAKVGDCINIYSLPAPSPTATPSEPTSQTVSASERVACAPGGYEVLKRIDATTADAACDAVTGTTSQYVSDQPLSQSDDFVLCLKKR